MGKYFIAAPYEDGFVRAVLCADPEPSGAASILAQHYKELDKLKHLMKYGDIRHLRRYPQDLKGCEERHRTKSESATPVDRVHIFRTPEQLALEGGKLYTAEYAFIWKAGDWYIAYLDCNYDGKLHKLT